jgi:uncharacterized protein YcnI
MRSKRAGARLVAVLAAGTVPLIAAATALGHAEISPAVALAKRGQLFTLVVPTEKDNAATTTVALTPPAGFTIDSFAPSPGWRRAVQSTGSGEQTAIQRVTWTGGDVPHGEDAVFQFLASTAASRTYAFSVRQTYSDGSVVDWSGPESSDTPAPTVESKSSLGGGGTNLLAIVALALAVVAVVVAGAGLLGRSGRRSLA